MTEESRVDLRVQKTERALTEALMTLLEEKTFDQITVSDLCDRAMIRRATFYKHFKDKYDFLEFCIDKRQRRFDQQCKENGPCEPLEYYTAIVRDMLRYMRENKALLDHSAKRSDLPPLADVFKRQLMRDIERSTEAMQQKNQALIAPPEIIAAFFSGALLGTARWWSFEAPDMTEDELLTHIQSVLSAFTPTINTENEAGNHER